MNAKANNTTDKVRKLQRKLYLSAKVNKKRRFHALYDKIYRKDILLKAWKQVKANGGTSGIDKIVQVLEYALARRRLTAFGGLLKEIHKELNLDDAEKGDLVNTDNDEELREDVDYVIERYKWNIGYNQYLKLFMERVP